MDRLAEPGSLRRMQLHRLACLGALSGLTLTANAQVPPTLPWSRTFDLFVSERANEDILRLRDLNQDGDYLDAGETIVFFTNASPTVPTVSGIQLASTTGVACGLDGTIFAATSTSDEIAALRDLNGDGDADDAGEATIWFSSAGNASGILLGSAQSITVDLLGRIFVLTANGGSPVVGIDGVVMIQDLDADGDAQDIGEASYYLQIPNASGAVAHSNPTEFAFGPDGALYYGDIGTNGPIARGIYRAADNNFDGDCNDLGEVTLWWVPTFTGVPAWYGFAFDQVGQLYVTNHGSGGRSVTRVQDLNIDGSIDATEQAVFYTATSGIWWDLVRRSDGVLLMIDSSPDAILAFNDLNADSDWLDPGEVTTAWDKNLAGFPTADLRAMTFMRAPQLTMTPQPVSIGTPVTWQMTTAEPFDLGVALGALTIISPISLPPFGDLEIDPSTLILFGLGVSNISCQAQFTLTLANDPALIGSYGCQAWCGELSRMFLSNPDSMIVTP